jgi:transposase
MRLRSAIADLRRQARNPYSPRGLLVWTAPYGIALCQDEAVERSQTREPSVNQIIRIGMDTSKHIFQLHGVDAAEQPELRKKLRRSEVLAFFAKLAPTVVGIEACGAAHYWRGC